MEYFSESRQLDVFFSNAAVVTGRQKKPETPKIYHMYIVNMRKFPLPSYWHYIPILSHTFSQFIHLSMRQPSVHAHYQSMVSLTCSLSSVSPPVEDTDTQTRRTSSFFWLPFYGFFLLNSGNTPSLPTVLKLRNVLFLTCDAFL